MSLTARWPESFSNRGRAYSFSSFIDANEVDVVKILQKLFGVCNRALSREWSQGICGDGQCERRANLFGQTRGPTKNRDKESPAQSKSTCR